MLGEVDPNGNVTATRKYDVYGSVRASTGTSTSKQKFVGGLGHPSDDETGLIYMRARYMDPVTGRFVNEDDARDSKNWFVYANNDPVNLVDPSGAAPTVAEVAWGLGLAFALAAVYMMYTFNKAKFGFLKDAPSQLAKLSSAANLANASIAWFGVAAVGMLSDQTWGYITAGAIAILATIQAFVKASEAGMYTLAAAAVAAAFIYGTILIGYTLSIGAENADKGG